MEGETARFLEAWFGVRQMIQAANFNRFHGAGLSATQFMALNLLPADGVGLSMGELARRMNLKPASVARTMESLEHRGLVERSRGAEDRRVVLVTITSAGRALQNSAQSQFRDSIATLFHAMAAGERTGLIAGLESLLRVAGGPPPTGTEPLSPGGAAPPASRSSARSRPGRS